MTRAAALGAFAALLVIPLSAGADVFNLGPGLINLDMVVVGDPGNAPDTRYATPGFGSVDYAYRIGKFEVTAAQYCDFLNHKAKSDPYGLYNKSMDTANSSSGCNIKRTGAPGSYSYSVEIEWANRPVNFVSFWDACRFVNWLHNGQGDGDTETGAYTLNGINDEFGNVSRNPEARWFLPNENEWYKAAYYKGGSLDAGYWDFPTRSDDVPGRDVNDVSGNNANYYQSGSGYTIGPAYFRTIVGEFKNSFSFYGTYDQGGNVAERNETVTEVHLGRYCRGIRGGSFSQSASQMRAVSRLTYYYPTEESDGVSGFGFRVAAVIPEPSSILALAAGLAMLAAVKRRNRQHPDASPLARRDS